MKSKQKKKKIKSFLKKIPLVQQEEVIGVQLPVA